MKKLDLGQAIQILANVGVIAGIAFLALQLQQNNRLLRAEAISAVLETRLSRQERVIAGVDLAALLQRNATQETLSPEDMMRVQAAKNLAFIGWQKDYFLYQEGILPGEYFRANFPVMKRAFGESGVVSSRNYWEQWSPTSATPAYRRFVDQCIFADCETIPE